MPKKAVTTKKISPAREGLKMNAVKKSSAPKRKTGSKPTAAKRTTVQKKTKSSKELPVVRYRCRVCGYIYSPLRGEPHNGIPKGTAFEDLPDTYVCPVCGFQGKGKVGKWGFDEWQPTRYICSICGYVYDEKRGEPHRGIRPGTKFDDLPDDYRCPVCALDPKITKSFGNVIKQGFGPLEIP